MRNFTNALSSATKQHLGVNNLRSVDVPQKVYIDREAGMYEYSEDGFLNNKVSDLLTGFYSNQNFIELFYSLPEIFAPVHEIASRVASCNFHLLKTRNDEIDYDDDDFNRLFTQPNPMTNMYEHIYQAVCYEILTGKQFFHFNKPTFLDDEFRSILTWNNLPAHCLVANMKKNVDYYVATEMSDYVFDYQIGNRHFAAQDVLPILHLGLESGYDINKCKPMVLGAEKAIKNLIPVYEARGVIYIKRGALGFLVSKKSDESGLVSLSAPEKQEAQDEYQGSYGLTRGKNQVGVVSSPVEFVKTAMSISELEPFKETLMDAIAIYAVLRVPPHLIPRETQSTYNNAAADMQSFYNNVIIPWAQRYADSWTNYMKLNDWKRWIKADFSHVAEIQENRKDRAGWMKVEGEVFEKRFMMGVATLNDWIVANGEKKIIGNEIYEKRVFEMTPEQITQVKEIINLKSTKNGDTENGDPKTEDTSTKDKGNNSK